ncbi:GH12989 [Drosophila grimshawi]|uniref:GH12989 n=2 Tax=Drosophila grimshawi TaxID=7222 RepID=B4K478_DROGR|nr:GH12989 [Drosophila grimshawi]
MNSKEYSSSKAQSMAVLDALQLTLRTRTLESKSIEPILMIELDCEYDACFMGLESEIYKQIIDYFRVMLV